MQRSYFLFKVLVVLAAVAVQLRVSLPSYSIMLGMNRKGVTITVARANAPREHKKDDVALLSSPGNKGRGVEIGMVRRPTSRRRESGWHLGRADAGSIAIGLRERPHRIHEHRAQGHVRTRGKRGAGRPRHGLRKQRGHRDGDGGRRWRLVACDRASLCERRSLSQPQSRDRAGAAARGFGEQQGAAERHRAFEAASSSKGPAAELIKEFANTVEAARKEAEQKSAEEGAVTETRQAAAETEVQASTSASLSPASPAEKAAPASRNDAAPPQTIARAETAAAPGDLAAKAPPETAIIPIPMQFVYRETSLTDDGRKAAALLLDYLKLKKFDAVTLSGHADERGTEEFNMELSRGRLEAVVELLRKGGYEGAVKILPKGESEPYAQVDRARFGHEDLMQLDRRVELRVAR